MTELFFKELDDNWKPQTAEPLLLRVIGSTALFLQSDYSRGTKDTDILEIDSLTPPIQNALTKLAGKDSQMARKHRMYLELVAPAFPFLPLPPLFHPIEAINKSLTKFRIEALDITDVIVSKLKPFRPQDRDDISAMIDLDLVPHDKLVERFRMAMTHWETDARAEDFPKYIENLNTVERDFFGVEESQLDLPCWMTR